MSGSEKVIAICQEINRLSASLGEEGFPTTERTNLRVFFTSKAYAEKFLCLILKVLGTIPYGSYNERLAYLKQMLDGMFSYRNIRIIDNMA